VNPAPIVRGLLDTPVVVDYREARPEAMQLFADIRTTRFPEFSQITAMVLLARCQDAADILGVQTFLKISTVHSITARITRRAQAILESLPPPSPLTADDALVAATALEQKLPLYTLDPPRFAGVAGLTALPPY
jgi:predicted nucleic acid-binding protein